MTAEEQAVAGKRNIIANFLSKGTKPEADDDARDEKEEPADLPQAEQLAESDAGDQVADAGDNGAASATDDSEGAASVPASDDGGDCEAGQLRDPRDLRIAELEAKGAEDQKRIADLETYCASLERQLAALKESTAKWASSLKVVKQGYEALEAKAASLQKDRDRLDGARLSLERANARLVEQNNMLMGGQGEAGTPAGDVDGANATATVKYEVLYTPPDPEIHEAIEDSSFFDEGEQVKAPEFHMPTSPFRR